jgi:hypoxanthine phosphoribosyltransferase
MSGMDKIKTEKKTTVLTEAAIADRVRELGKQITSDYQGHELLVIGILNGAFIFTADLVRSIDLPLRIDFIRVASYGNGMCSSGELCFTKDVELPIDGADILLVEDIVDTGRTIACLKEKISSRKPRSVRVCTLIDKRERREVEVDADYVGFAVSEGFLVGYGLDCAEKFRNLPGVYALTV